MSSTSVEVSIIFPAKNEESTIGSLVAAARRVLPGAEIIVVDDGSTDATSAIATAGGARVIRHPVSKGNGAAVKSGARIAHGSVLILMDADGQHNPADVPQLLRKLEEGNDLVVGARSASSQASLWRLMGNSLYNWLASWVVGHRVIDLTSGFRAVRTERFREFLHLMPNGFSYPTTSTMAFFRAGYSVAFLPIEAQERPDHSRSHIRLLRDGARFLLIIFRIGTLYSPLKIFFPISLFFLLTGLSYCTYTLVVLGRFTNFGALLLVTALLIFFMGLISEQITQLLYAQRGEKAVRP